MSVPIIDVHLNAKVQVRFILPVSFWINSPAGDGKRDRQNEITHPLMKNYILVVQRA